MSQWSFNARCELNTADSAKQWFFLLAAAKTEVDTVEQNKMLIELNANVAEGGSLIDASCLHNINLKFADELLVDIEAGSELNYDFFVGLVEHFEKLGVTNYRARLYDSSSNSMQSWLQPDVEINWQEKTVCIIGVDEEEGIHDALIEQGAELVDIDQQDIEVVIFDDDMSLHTIKDKVINSPEIIMISEDDVWDYLEEAFS